MKFTGLLVEVLKLKGEGLFEEGEEASAEEAGGAEEGKFHNYINIKL
jgi:hypothetical protein